MLTSVRSGKRIAITGASGVGKTTLAERLSVELDLPLIPEMARQLCQERGYSRIGDIRDQEGFKRQVLSGQMEAEEQHGSFVSDRPAIDCWVLWQRWNICSAMTYDSESYYELCCSQATSYTHVIYIPPLFAAVDDAFRWTEADYQKQIDRIVRMTLFDFGLLERTWTIKTVSVEERAEEVVLWLKK